MKLSHILTSLLMAAFSLGANAQGLCYDVCPVQKAECRKEADRTAQHDAEFGGVLRSANWPVMANLCLHASMLNDRDQFFAIAWQWQQCSYCVEKVGAQH